MKDTTPRPQRKALPTKEFLLSLVYLFTEKGQTSLPKGWFVKSHAEKHDPKDTKGDKLLIVAAIKKINKKGEVLPIVLKRNGQKVCQLNYFGILDGGGFRYYAPVMGFKCGANLDVYIGDTKYGKINGGFRDFMYRN
jgi:hypothetical protein